ncbi:hypothetical protein [uncultured Empedobacter sp.]|uniref:hypothetical protein n=1 Tax=uncultured Empedobacter sp. TaxID=410844 RepID=UPI002615B12C|nr:hypothetical protein [uncultured Empedobacter sp.]
MQKYTFGLTAILVGAVLPTGLMPSLATLKKIGEVNEGSASMTMEKGESTKIYEEGNPTPKVVIPKPDSVSFEFALLDATPELIKEYLGGVTEGATAVGFLGKTIQVEKAVLVKPDQGVYFAIPRASITATIGGEFNSDGTLVMTMTVEPLDPGNDKSPISTDYLANLEANLPPAG